MSYLRVVLMSSIYGIIYAVPPEACFAKFRWDDCGKPAVPVMYYWKSGSRCEVGLWRGCLPNINMFKDEYECVQTCIFTARAQPVDYHELMKEENNIMSHETDDECKRKLERGEDPGEECRKTDDEGSTSAANTTTTTVPVTSVSGSTSAAVSPGESETATKALSEVTGDPNPATGEGAVTEAKPAERK